MDAAKHLFFDTLRLVGMRDRLRCPECKAVGTYKPHGGIWDTTDERRERRWMCKWCGHYEGPEGISRARPNPKGYWDLETTANCVEFHTWKTPRELVAPINPWRG